METEAKASAEERREGLNRGIQQALRQGWRVESQSDFSAALVKGKRPNHLLHLFLTIFTAGLWGIVWIILAITKHEHRRLLQVDEYGDVFG